MLYSSQDGRGVWGQWMHLYIYMAESLCCSPETIVTLLTGYTPIQNKKFFKKNNPMLTHHYHQKSTVEL